MPDDANFSFFYRFLSRGNCSWIIISREMYCGFDRESFGGWLISVTAFLWNHGGNKKEETYKNRHFYALSDRVFWSNRLKDLFSPPDLSEFFISSPQIFLNSIWTVTTYKTNSGVENSKGKQDYAMVL